MLIYCAGRGGRYADIAVAAGFVYGCRSDYKPSHTVGFADLNWKTPDLERHLRFVQDHRPLLAVAPDVLELSDLGSTLRYAESLAEWADRVILVPKAQGVMDRLPREPWLVVGYSVPTSYGGSDMFMAEMNGWPVHLLGGLPGRQLELAHYLDVFSADGNAAAKAAEYGAVFDGRKWRMRAEPLGPDMPYRAFKRSCDNIMRAWALSPTRLRGGAGPVLPCDPASLIRHKGP